MAKNSYSSDVSKVWLALVVLGIGWGILTGLAFSDDYWLDPAVAIFGCLGLCVSGVSFFVAIRNRGFNG